MLVWVILSAYNILGMIFNADSDVMMCNKAVHETWPMVIEFELQLPERENFK